MAPKLLVTEQLQTLTPRGQQALIDRLSDGATQQLVDDVNRERGVMTTLGWYRPRGAAAELRDTTATEVLLSGPAGTGKSLGVLAWMFDLAVHNPGMRGLMIRKTAKSLTGSALVTWREHVIAEAKTTGYVDFYGGSAEEPAQYRFHNGSKVMLSGMDNSDRVMSTEFDYIFVQEAIELTLEDWEKLITRLRHGVLETMQLVGDTNPSTPTHWLKQRCNRGATQLIQSRHEDNPTLFDDTGEASSFGLWYLGILDQITGVRKERLRFGRWVSAEGIIYDLWDEAVHIVDQFVPPDDWDRYWVIDFGLTNPFVCQWWAVDGDGRHWLYREWYRSDMIVEDHAKIMLLLTRDMTSDDIPEHLEELTPESDLSQIQSSELRALPWCEPKPKAIICDHDAEGRATLKRHLGLGTTAAKKTVVPGIEVAQVRLRKQADGLPRALFMRDALVSRDPILDREEKPCSTIEEITGYIWAKSPDGKPNKEEPLKLNDHGCDCYRYHCAHHDLGMRPTIRHFG